MTRILVHIEQPTARARYALDHLLRGILGLHVEYIDRPLDAGSQDAPLLFYGRAPVPGAFHIAPAGLLERTGLETIDPAVGAVDGMPVLFPTTDGDLPFDPFAGAFYLLTRHEELTGVDLDMHGRPVTATLHGAKHGYLDRPVVDEWAMHLGKALQRFDPRIEIAQRTYRQVATIDLDNGFKYLGREVWRSVGAASRDLFRADWSGIRDRIAVLAGQRKDPFDVYAELERLIAPYADRVVFFVLTSARGPMDHAIPITHPRYRSRLNDLGRWAEVGIHPSYDSSVNTDLIGKQYTTLRSVVPSTGRLSRQHFLRLRLPDTYRALIAAGITEDHTMGLHDRIGFRAGTCTPYPWFDIPQETVTPLMVHPFAVMDNTLRNKLHWTPGEAVEHTTALIQRIRTVQGTFTGLWHESFLSDSGEFRGWAGAVERIIRTAAA
ncbi:MAG: polysaccharide deacetylase family protein [Flavobacteriales bacterium]